MAANQVPNMLAPKYVKSLNESEKGESVKREILDENRKTKLWEQLDVSGSKEWTKEQKKLIKETFESFHDVFALTPLELGRTSLVQHTIKITDPKPFKERYRRIPSHQFEEV